MRLGTRTFGGMVPVVDPHNLPETSAALARNCKIQSGALRPWANPLTIQAAQHSGSIFLYKDIWLTWVSKLISAVLSPVANDSHGRLYWTGDGAPKYASEEMIGTLNAPASSYDLGIPAPVNAPVAAVIGSFDKFFAIRSIRITSGGLLVEAYVSDSISNINSDAILELFSTGIATLDIQMVGFVLVSNSGGILSFTVKGVTTIGNGTITGITNANPAVVTSVGHNLHTGDTVLHNLAGMPELNGLVASITVIDDDTYTPTGIDSTWFGVFVSGTWDLRSRIFTGSPYSSVDILVGMADNISKANPAKVTHLAHGLTTGQAIRLYDMVGMIQLEGWTGSVTLVDVDNFTLDGVDSTGYGTFFSGSYVEIASFKIYSDATLQESRSYVYRYRSSFGEVGPPSPPSDAIIVSPGQSVAISGMDTAPAGNYDISDKEIFRTNAGSTTTEYQFTDEVAVATTTYTDSKAAAALGEVLNSLLWDAPLSGLQGLVAHPSGSLVGYVGNLLCFSAPYQPHAWPITNQYPVKDLIKGIGVYGNSIAVTTTGAPYVASGSDPSAMTVDRLEKGYANVSATGIVDIGYAAVYPSTLGLMMVNLRNISLVTEKTLSIKEWQAYSPETFRGFFYDGFYFALGDVKSLIFDLNSGELSEIDQLATAAYHDPASGFLYLVVDGNIVKWDGDSTGMTFLWKSKVHDLPRPSNMSCAKILADSYPVTLILIGDGNVKATKTVADNKPFKLPGGYLSKEIQYSVQGTSGVYEVIIAESMTELRGRP
jgi:hypothetical protein